MSLYWDDLSLRHGVRVAGLGSKVSIQPFLCVQKKSMHGCIVIILSVTKTMSKPQVSERDRQAEEIYRNLHNPFYEPKEIITKEERDWNVRALFLMFPIGFIMVQVFTGFDMLYLPGGEWDLHSFISSILTFVSIFILVFVFLNSTATEKEKLYVGWSYLLFVFVLILAYVIAEFTRPTKQDPPKQDPPKQDPPVVPPEPPVVTPPPPKPVVTSKPVQQSSTAVQIALAVGIPLTLLVFLWWLYNKRSKQKYANASPGVTVAQSVTAAPRVTAPRARKKNHRAHKKPKKVRS